MKASSAQRWKRDWARPLLSISEVVVIFVAGSPQCSNIPTCERSQYAMILHARRGEMQRVTSRELNQDVSRAKRVQLVEPEFVTDRGRPTHVLSRIPPGPQGSGPPDNRA